MYHWFLSPRIARISLIFISTYRTDHTDFLSLLVIGFYLHLSLVSLVLFSTYLTCFFSPRITRITRIFYLYLSLFFFLHVSLESLVYFFHVLLQLIVSTDLTDYTDFFPPLVVIFTYLTYHTCIFLHVSLESLVYFSTYYYSLLSPRIARITRILFPCITAYSHCLHGSHGLHGFFSPLQVVISTYHSYLTYFFSTDRTDYTVFFLLYRLLFPRITLISRIFSPRIARITRIFYLYLSLVFISTYHWYHSYYFSTDLTYRLYFFPLITVFFLHGSLVSHGFFSLSTYHWYHSYYFSTDLTYRLYFFSTYHWFLSPRIIRISLSPHCATLYGVVDIQPVRGCKNTTITAGY